MRRAFGPLAVEIAADGTIRELLGRLLECAPASIGNETGVIRVRAASHKPSVALRQSDFHVGCTQAWIGVDGAVTLLGGDRAIVVHGADVLVWIEPERAWSDAEIEEVALVDLACALFLAARAFGLWHVHAACVEDPVLGATLIVGQSGSGKSTTTLALMTQGARWLADDTVLMGRGPAGLQVYGVPRLFHVSDATLRFFPGLRSACLPNRRSLQGKHCLDPERAFPGASVVAPVVPVLVLLPAVCGTRTHGEVGAAADALGALLESSTWVTIEGLPGNTEHLDALASVAGSMCCVRLALAADIFSDVGRLRAAVLEAVDASGQAPAGSASPF